MKNIAAQIQSLKFTEVKSICVAFQVGTYYQWPTLTDFKLVYFSQ